jgi:1,2-dihydroxy-3-keto-5-methylthiopentene dioxygenase
MTALTIYKDDAGKQEATYTDFAAIADALKDVGVQMERWEAAKALSADAGEQEVLDAYRESIDQLREQYNFQSVDVVSLRPDHPQKDQMRQKFLDEHTHADFEIRFFVDGRGLFYLHMNSKVYLVLCEKGDLISVPANTTHWFDMGKQPDFKCIRFFTTADGWVGDFTGSDIANKFPTFDEFVAGLNR